MRIREHVDAFYESLDDVVQDLPARFLSDIVFHFNSKEDIEQAFNKVLALDLDDLIRQREDARTSDREEELNQITACWKCGKEMKYRYMRHTPGSILCPDCYKLRQRFCAYCGVEFVIHPDYPTWICKNCKTRERTKQEAIIKGHLRRAEYLNLPHTLTLKEWLDIVEKHHGRCAYCGGPYTDLEHSIPLSRGGGTTADNCVPSCGPCNTRKKDMTGQEFKDIFNKKEG